MTIGPGDTEVLSRWWEGFLATGQVPAELELVQGRLIRSVHRGELPSGTVYVKTMTFPRAKDRLRYAFRALPATHEAAMLGAVAAAGVRCPEVVAVHTARRAGLPFRSMLVLRALPVVPEPTDVAKRLHDEAVVGAKLLAKGIEHRDLHGGNFVRLTDGTLAVLDLQSASQHAAPREAPGDRVAAAARLLREHLAASDEVAAALCASGLLRNREEIAGARARAAAEQLHFQRGRVLRCLGESTEFTRELRWNGILHRTREPLPEGYWLPPSAQARQQWLGQRARQVFGGAGSASLVFPAFFRKWWWPRAKGTLYVPRTCSEVRIHAELLSAVEGFEHYRSVIESR
jgi:hypothetical protein